MTEPNDRELEQYLKGGSPLSRRYREASGETAPPELDEAILAQARAEAGRKPPSLNRVLAPVALAASVVLGVNLAWNLKQAEPLPPMPAEAPLPVAMSEDDAVREEPAQRPAKPEAKAELRRRAPAPPAPEYEAPARLEESAGTEATRESAQQAAGQAKAEERADLAKRIESQQRASKMKDEAGVAAPVVDSAPVAAASAPAAPAAAVAPAAARAAVASLSEAQKIDRLIGYVAALQDAVFIRNSVEHAPAEAARHLQLKREKAGSRVKSADDFIRLCAAYSSMSGEAYLIRFADGRTRTAEDVLREELARLNAAVNAED